MLFLLRGIILSVFGTSIPATPLDDSSVTPLMFSPSPFLLITDKLSVEAETRPSNFGILWESASTILRRRVTPSG
jgi:hypothetical protein